MARQYEGGHDETVGVHYGHRDGPVVRQALLEKIRVVHWAKGTVSQVLFFEILFRNSMLEATYARI